MNRILNRIRIRIKDKVIKKGCKDYALMILIGFNLLIIKFI